MQYPYDIQRKLRFAPVPTYEFQIGDEVEKENFFDAIVISVSNDKMVYGISYSEGKEKDGKIEITNTGLKTYVLWYEIRHISKNNKSFIQHQDLKANYELKTIQSQIDRILFFGCNFETDYRKEHHWTKKQKTNYISSIFENAELGKFKIFPCFNQFMYECVDGAERLKTICEYYTDNFFYHGKKFSDLSKNDKDFFLNKFIQVADLDYKTKKEKIRQHYINSNKFRLK